MLLAQLPNPFTTDAPGQTGSGCVDSQGTPTLQCIPNVFHTIILFLLGMAGITAVIFIVISGIKFMTSGGDPKQVEGARKTITWAIIGLIIVITSFAILSFISGVFHVPCILKFGFTNCS